MNYKNIVLALVFLAVSGLFFVSGGQPAKAACGTTLECQIAVIMEQIKALQTQLLVLQGQQSTSPWCYDFYTNFGIGTSSADFGALVTVLDRENISEFTSFNRPALYNEVIAGGVVKLQAKYGILQTGYVGPITRAKLNTLYGCSTVVATQPSVKILSPNGGETYNSGSSLNITWATTGIMPLETIDLIRLRSYTTGQEYSLVYTVFNDGQEIVVIPPSVPVGSYILEIKTYKNNILVFDVSDSYFKIVSDATQSSVTVISPIGGEQWVQGSTHFIIWNNTGVANMAIDILGVNGQYRVVSLPNLPPGNGSYNWTVGNTLSGSVMPAGQYRLTVYNADNPAVQSFSNYFNIVASTTTGTYPLNISSVMGMKATYTPGETISFSVKGLKVNGAPASNSEGFNVQAYVCKNGDCNNYLPPNPAASYNGNYNSLTGLWDVSMSAPSDSTPSYSMRVVLYCSQMNSSCWSNYGGYYNGMLNGQVERLLNFSIVSNLGQPSVSFVSPQPASVGSPMTVYFSNGGSTGSVILKNLNGTKQWHIPYTTGTVYSGFTYYDGSKVTFMVPSTIGRGQLPENTGYEAPISITSGTYNLFVYSTGGSTSNAFPITINAQPYITVTSPNGGENYVLGSNTMVNVRWTATGGNIVYVYLAFSDGGMCKLGSDVPTGFFNFNPALITCSNIPRAIVPGQYKIALYLGDALHPGISDGDGTARDFSDNYFNITSPNIVQPSITITSPNGGEVWKYGETRRVTWTSQGVKNVAIYVGNDTVYGSGSTNYLDPAGVSLSVPASQGYFDWNILQSWLPKTTYGNENRYKIRITDSTSYAGVSDSSDNYFSIIASDNTFITWTEAKNLIENCNVKSVMQLHNLSVYLTLWSDLRRYTVEPSIDEVIRVVQSVTSKCGNIPIATE